MRAMRWLFALLLLIVVAAPLWIVSTALESMPRVSADATLSVADAANAKQLLREHDPRRLRDGDRRLVRLSERELNLLLSYTLPEFAAGRAILAGGLMTLAASIEVPANPFGRYLNAEVTLAQSGTSLEPVALSLGQLRLPSWLTGSLSARLSQLLRAQVPEYAVAMNSLQSLQFEDSGLVLEYIWRDKLLDQARARGRELVLPADLRESARAYYGTLAAQAQSPARGASLARPLQALFAQARQRSVAGRDPALENRAALLALGVALTGRSPAFLYEEGSQPPARIRRLGSTLRGRHDLAQHFVVSALLTLSGGGKLADAIGVLKELSDSRGGSGFSFPDLLADRAGVVFAQRSTGPDAKRIQQRLAENSSEDVFMPSIDALPEGMQDLEFRRRYEDLDTEAYGRVRDEVERRIMVLPLYRQP